MVSECSCSEDEVGSPYQEIEPPRQQRSVASAQGSVSTVDCSSYPFERSPVIRRLKKQKTNMLRAKNEGVAREIEIHVEGHIHEARYSDAIHGQSLIPDDLDRALRNAERDGFKVGAGREGRLRVDALSSLFVAFGRKPGCPHKKNRKTEK